MTTNLKTFSIIFISMLYLAVVWLLIEQDTVIYTQPTDIEATADSFVGLSDL